MCALLKHSFKLSLELDNDCILDANSIIVTPPTTPTHSCKPDYYNYGGICYRKITAGSSWSSALATCEADGATLATIHNEGENAALYVFANDVTPFWIGYHKV